MAAISSDILYSIQRRDPNGGNTEPTDADYARHKTWAVEQYGQEAWNAYMKPGWGNDGLDIV